MAMTDRDKKALIVLGSVLFVAAVVFFFISRGSKGGSTKAATGSTGSNDTVAVVPPSVTPSPTPQDKAKSILVFTGRDPFQVLLTAATSPPPSGSPSPTSSPSVSPAGSPPPAPTGGSSVTIGGHTVVLIDIFKVGTTEKAQVEVDGTVYTVTIGETFASSFKLTDIHHSSDACADFLFGDQSFELCETANK